MRPLLAALLFAAPLLADDETDFAAPPPASWQRFDPTERATFDFTEGDFHLTCPVPTLAEDFPARASLFSPTEFTATVVMADVTSWIATTNRSINGCFNSVVSRIQDPAEIGTASGYGLSMVDLGNGTAQLQIHRITNESPLRIAGPATFPLNPAKDYRLVLSSFEEFHTGRVFDVANLAQPLATVTGTDFGFSSGRAGISISTDRVVGLDVRVDNFLAWDGTLPPLFILPGDLPGQVKLRRDARRSLAARLESAVHLVGPWLPAPPVLATVAGGEIFSVHAIDGPRRFYHLAWP